MPDGPSAKKNPLRVGLFSSSLPGPDRKPGGADIVVHNLGNELARRGHDISVISFSEAPEDALYAVRRLRPDRYAHSRLARLLIVPAMLNALDTSGLDVLHLHGDDWFFVRREVPTVRTFHGSALDEARTATRLRRRLVQSATFLLELGASRLATRSYMVGPNHTAPYALAGILPNGIHVPTSAALSRPAPPTILFVGTWSGRKRGKLLYDVFQRDILPRVPTAQLHMVSDECPPGRNVHWWRNPSHSTLHELYQTAWVFCLPSAYEGFGLPYGEAMAAGTPVVATPNPGALGVIGGDDAGLVVDDNRLGQTLVNLLRDPERRLELAAAGRRRVEEFSWKRVIELHERAYEEAISSWRAKRPQPRQSNGLDAREQKPSSSAVGQEKWSDG